MEDISVVHFVRFIFASYPLLMLPLVSLINVEDRFSLDGCHTFNIEH